jgi:hypothetical protein
VTVDAGSCGFRARITSTRAERREVRIEIESDCEAASELGLKLEKLGPFGMRDVMAKGTNGNRILVTGMNTLSHAGCPILAGIIKACEVEMGLNVPRPVTIEFDKLSEQED